MILSRLRRCQGQQTKLLVGTVVVQVIDSTNVNNHATVFATDVVRVTLRLGHARNVQKTNRR